MSTTIPCAGCERREACELIERCLDKTPLHDDYKPLDLSQIASAPPDGGPKLEACPACGSEAGLWQYSESETAPRQLVVMCSHGEAIGPQDGIRNEGCLLYMPPEAFYQARIADAVRYWNEFAKALTAMRTGGVTPCDEAQQEYEPVGDFIARPQPDGEPLWERAADWSAEKVTLYRKRPSGVDVGDGDPK